MSTGGWSLLPMTRPHPDHQAGPPDPPQPSGSAWQLFQTGFFNFLHFCKYLIASSRQVWKGLSIQRYQPEGTCNNGALAAC